MPSNSFNRTRNLLASYRELGWFRGYVRGGSIPALDARGLLGYILGNESYFSHTRQLCDSRSFERET